MTHRAFDFETMSPRDCYKVLIGTVVPRPIAWVTTVSPDGVPNAAPYSFFNCLSSDPPILALGIENRDGARFKDTAWNIRSTEAFTVNVVDHACLEAMNITAAAFGAGIDELEMADLDALPGTRVPCPRIARAPVSFECVRHVGVQVGRSREIVLGRVLLVHAREDVIDPSTLHTDASRLDAIGRMGGHGYAFTRQCFELLPVEADDVVRRKGVPGTASD